MGIRVIITDDEEIFRASLARLLTRRGFIVQTCASGEETLTVLDHGSYDVIVLDLRMPGMDGLETLAEIRRRQPLLPVLLLSGMGDLPSVTAALSQGVTNFMAKPCAVENIINAIEDAHEHHLLSERSKKHFDPNL